MPGYGLSQMHTIPSRDGKGIKWHATTHYPEGEHAPDRPAQAPAPHRSHRATHYQLTISPARVPLAPEQRHQGICTHSPRTPNSPEYAPGGRLQGNQGGVAQPGNIGVAWEELRLVNEIREEVSRWKEAGYPGITSTTRALVNHWTDREEFLLYFAQIDTVLTHIYLREINPTEVTRKLREINSQYNDQIDRIAHKMATATGKTPVMAMIILWQAANQYASSQEDARFVRRFLLLTPGLTVKERLQDSLDPRRPNNDWKAFNLLPSGDIWEPALASSSINIANYHQLEPRTLGLKPSDRGQLLIDGGANPTTLEEMLTRVETPEEMVERIADGRTQKGNIVVINDEGHHCHRGDPTKRNQKDTEWFAGIRHIRDTNQLAYVTDMSATPIYLAQSNPRPFHWIVSDYSLVDAIEAGLTKIPRVPTKTTDEQNSKYRDIFSNTETKQTSDFRPEDTGNNILLKEALGVLYQDYEERDQQWKNRSEVPVMAIVMNSVKNANAMYRHVAGGADTPLFGNYTGGGHTDIRADPRTIIVHSKLEDGEAATGETGKHIKELSEAYRRNPKHGFTDDQKPEEIIRKVMNTVGRPGQPGENVRCVISVNMLTEGWNTKTVTHLLGFRKFGSSLLCEQVAGRTLRRITNDFQEENDLLFKPEFAQIFGIPFPQYEEPEERKEKDNQDWPPVLVEPVDSQRRYRVEWPNIIKLERPGTQQAIQVKAKSEGPDETHQAANVDPETSVVEGVAGPSVEMTRDEQESREHFLYLVAHEVVKTIEREATQKAETAQPDEPVIQVAKLFGQTLMAAQEYYQGGHLTGPTDDNHWPTDDMTILKTGQWLHRNVDVIKPETGQAWLEAIPSAINPWQHTGELREYDTGENPKKVYGPTIKSEISYAHCDSEWEVWVARQLDEMEEVDRWARNKGLNWAIPYVADRQQKSYWPDFVAVVKLDGNQELNIVIEVKGLERDNDPVKRRWAQEYWAPAVNRHEEYGEASGRTWAYLYLDNEALALNAAGRIRQLIDEHQKVQAKI